jgi:hypothetical protein
MGKGKGKRKDQQRTLKKRKRMPVSYILNALVEEGDRGCVLVGYAYLEYHLEWLLKAYFRACNKALLADGVESVDSQQIEILIDETVNPDDPQAMLGSGARTAALAALMGLIDPYTLRLFRRIKSLRIDCAHNIQEVRLVEESLKPIVAALSETDARKMQTCIDEGKSGWQFLFGPEQQAGKFSDARLQFMFACITVDSAIQQKIIELESPDGPTGFCLGGFTYTIPPGVAHDLLPQTPPSGTATADEPT